MSDSVPHQTVEPPGTSAPQASAVQGVTGGVPIAISGAISASTSAHATAAAPTYVEGTDNPLSVDLSGNLRTSGGGGGGGSSDVALHDNGTPANHLAINGSGQAAIQNPPNLDAAASTLATQATLALIKAKTDNLDVALSTRTKPADTQTVAGTVMANQGSPVAAASAWPIKVTEDTTHTAVEPGDATNKAIRVNVVAATGSTTFFGATETGTGDGVTTTFTLLHTPTDEPRVFVGGARMTLGTDYTRVGTLITWIYIPPASDAIQVDYTWSMASATLSSTLVVDASGHTQPTGDAVARSIYVLPSGGDLTSGSQLAQITDSDGDRANVTKLGSLQAEAPSRDRAIFEDRMLSGRDAEFIAMRMSQREVRIGFTDRRGLSGQRGIR